MHQTQKIKNGSDGKRSISVASSYQGPLPPPEMLQAYNECFPGSGEIILNEFKNQGSHRRFVEKSIVLGQLFFGPVLAISVVLSGIFIGYKLLMGGKNLEGFVALVAPLALAGGLFIWNRSGRKKKE